MLNVQWIPVARYLFTCALLYCSFSELFVRIWWNSADLISFYFRGFPSNFPHVVYDRFYQKKTPPEKRSDVAVQRLSHLLHMWKGTPTLADFFVIVLSPFSQITKFAVEWVAHLFRYLDGVSASYPDLHLIHTFRMVKILPSWPQ